MAALNSALPLFATVIGARNLKGIPGGAFKDHRPYQ